MQLALSRAGRRRLTLAGTAALLVLGACGKSVVVEDTWIEGNMVCSLVEVSGYGASEKVRFSTITSQAAAVAGGTINHWELGNGTYKLCTPLPRGGEDPNMLLNVLQYTSAPGDPAPYIRPSPSGTDTAYDNAAKKWHKESGVNSKKLGDVSHTAPTLPQGTQTPDPTSHTP